MHRKAGGKNIHAGFMAILTALLCATTAAAQELACDAVFPSPVSAHDPDASLTFLGGSLQGVTEPLAARHLVDQSFSPLSCGGHSCAISGTPAPAVPLPPFQQTASERDISVSSPGYQHFQGSDREFRNITLMWQSQLRLSPAGQVWRIRNLTLNSESTLVLAPGDYWVENLTAQYRASIRVEGEGTVRLHLLNDAEVQSSAMLNPGPGNLFDRSQQMLLVGYGNLTLHYAAEAAASVYARGRVTLHADARVHGDISAASATFMWHSLVSAIDDSARQRTDYGALCQVDGTAPEITLDNPPESRTTDRQIVVRGTVTDNHQVAGARLSNDRYGSPFEVPLDADGRFSVTVPLQVGDNHLTLSATDVAGNQGSAAILVHRAEPPRLVNISPANGSLLREEIFTLSGEVQSELPADQLRLHVNGARVSLGDGEGSHPFAIPGLPLAWGNNRFTIAVASSDGDDSLTLDLSRLPEDDESLPPPQLEILAPTDGYRSSADSVDVAGQVIAAAGSVEVQINGNPVTVTGAAASGNFRRKIFFEAGSNALSITVTATDQLGRTTTETLTVYRDSAAPVITLDAPLLPYPDSNAVQENPYRLTGTVTDERLAGMLVDNQAVALTATAVPGEYRFSVDIPLSAGTRTLSLRAQDVSGNQVTESYQLSIEPSALLNILVPAAGGRFLIEESPQTAEVVARLQGQAPGAEVFAVVGEQQFPLSLNGSLIEGEIELPEEDGEHTLRIRVEHSDVGLLAAASVPFTVINLEQRPLELVRMQPVANSTFISPNQLFSFHFNRPVDPAQLQIVVRETLHGETYLNQDKPGVDFLHAKGYEIATVYRSMELVPGTIDLVPGRRAATFVADRYFGYGARLQVEVRHGEDILARAQLQVRPLPTQVSGNISDQFGEPVAGITVQLGERSTTTNGSGGFTFGQGSEADSPETVLTAGDHWLVINPDMRDPRFGTRRQQVSLQAGRLNRLGIRAVPLLNETTGFTGLRSGAVALLADDQLEIDLSNAQLNGPDGRGSVVVNPQFLRIERLGLETVAPAPLFGVYALQPEGLEVEGRLGLNFAVPLLNGRRDWMEEGTRVVISGLDRARAALVPVAVGEVQGERVHLRGSFEGQWLDYIGLALPPEAAAPAIQAWLDDETSWPAVRAALAEGAN
ncbi:hypothetical protein [Microbulbifer sp.]|uniref:hypothetical protein n=1 Tax=Microbulbifer sp. TaxID=1908541 RepID=UPI003F2C7928